MGVHAGDWVAKRHGTCRIAVVAVLKRDELVATLDAAIEPVLHGHLHRYFDRYRS